MIKKMKNNKKQGKRGRKVSLLEKEQNTKKPKTLFGFKKHTVNFRKGSGIAVLGCAMLSVLMTGTIGLSDVVTTRIASLDAQDATDSLSDATAVYLSRSADPDMGEAQKEADKMRKLINEKMGANIKSIKIDKKQLNDEKIFSVTAENEQHINGTVENIKRIASTKFQALNVFDVGNVGETNYVITGDSKKGKDIVASALTKLGCRYYWGQAGPKYFDCSGLVVWAYGQHGISVPHSAASLCSISKKISRNEVQAGDLCFFTNGSGSRINHVGICIGDGTFVQASGKGSGTVGQYPDQCVKVTRFSNYYRPAVAFGRLY